MPALEWEGALSLFTSCFLAATILPFSSEVIVLGTLKAGYDVAQVIAIASAGNTLGALSSYALGRLLAAKTQAKLETSRSGRLALAWVERYGGWCMLLSFAPVLGDPIMMAGGLFRIGPLPVFMGILTRILRYIALTLAL